MPTVTVQPSGYRIAAVVGDSIMTAARAAGYHWPTTCGGNGECTTCACTVLNGAENLDAMSRFEHSSLVEGRGRAVAADIRLACQARVRGDVEVRRPGVLPPPGA